MFGKGNERENEKTYHANIKQKANQREKERRDEEGKN